MARLPRLSVAQHAHLVLLRGHNGETVFRDDADRQSFLLALRLAFGRERVALHAYALKAECIWLLCTPPVELGLGRAMQSMGRRFAAAFNRRHGRTGSLWDGRFRSSVVEAGEPLLEAMLFVDQLLAPPQPDDAQEPPVWSSARQHLGFEGAVPMTDIAEYWALGNTPFDRAAAYRRLLIERRGDPRFQQIERSVSKGWVLGSAPFVADLQARLQRPIAPRPRGRPRHGT
jgi:putative transposase